MGTLAVAAFYLIAQMVGAGVLIQALVGIDFSLAVVLTGAFMLCYVIFGGMLATTWVQIIKAVLLMAGIVVMSLFVLERVGFNPIELFNQAEDEHDRRVDVLARAGDVPLVADRHRVARPRAGARHGRPAAHPDALLHRSQRPRRARLGRLGDVPDRRLLPADDVHRLRRARRDGRGRRRGGGHRRQPGGAEPGAGAGGGEGTFGGDLFLAVIAGVAFATILAVVAGLVLSASGAVAHDIWSSIIRKGQDSEAEEVVVAKIAAASIGVIAILVAVIGGEGLNVSFMVGLAFAIAAMPESSSIRPNLTARSTPSRTTGGSTECRWWTRHPAARALRAPIRTRHATGRGRRRGRPPGKGFRDREERLLSTASSQHSSLR